MSNLASELYSAQRLERNPDQELRFRIDLVVPEFFVADFRADRDACALIVEAQTIG